jgi:hypothetical protein
VQHGAGSETLLALRNCHGLLMKDGLLTSLWETQYHPAIVQQATGSRPQRTTALSRGPAAGDRTTVHDDGSRTARQGNLEGSRW